MDPGRRVLGRRPPRPAAGGGRTGGAGTVLATSPIYQVTDAATGARLKAAGGSWLGLAGLVADRASGVRLAVRDPNGSGDGMVAAGSLGEAVWDKDGMDASRRRCPRRCRAPGRCAAPTSPCRTGPGRWAWFPSTRWCPAGRVERPATVLAPADLTALLRFTWLPTESAPKTPPRAAALGKLRAALKAPPRRRRSAPPSCAGPAPTRRPRCRPAGCRGDREAARGARHAPRRPRLRRLVRAGPAQQHPARGRRVRLDAGAGAGHVHNG